MISLPVKSVLGRRFPVLAIFLWVFMPATAVAQSGVTSKTTYEYYKVSGKTDLDILLSVMKEGPRFSGRKGWAAMKTEFNTDVDLISGKSCRMSRYNVQMAHTIILPRHPEQSQLPKAQRSRLIAFTDLLKRHEEEHRSITRSCMQTMRKRLLALPGKADCEAFAQAARALIDEEQGRCLARHEAFDKRDVAKAPKMPLVREALAQAEVQHTRLPAVSFDHTRRRDMVDSMPVYSFNPSNR